jgi:PIN domain nuclease of toxin-antitoxin system
MSRAVLDTHALLWYTLFPADLSPGALHAIDACERDGGVASAISVWEIALKAQRNSSPLPPALSIDAYVAKLRQLQWLEIRAVDTDTWLASAQLDWAHRDPADRVIVATARALGLPIITKDAAMRAFYPNCVW